jgi:uncharacterized membrane protein YdjX (TVP38/TMEM64 family)
VLKPVGKPTLWWSLAGVMLLLGGLLWLQQYGLEQINLPLLQGRVAQYALWVDAHRALAALGFALVYVLVATLSIPLAPVLSLVGGALFGWGLGVPLVLGSRALGATLAAALVRGVLRARLRVRHRQQMDDFDARVRMDGAWYLLSLRLLPAFPFVLVNVLSGLSAMPLRTFFWVSLLGMLPATSLQVLAGVQLAQLRALTDLEPSWAWLSLVGLALLPWPLRRWFGRQRPAN